MPKIKIGIIFGGRSGEHEVSVQSAASIIDAINKDKYDIFPIGITKSGRWIPGISPKTIINQNMLEVREELVRENGYLSCCENNNIIPPHLNKEDIQVIFPVLHGPYGEDGTVQGLLELLGLAYIGGGVLASSLGMDKALMKQVFEANRIPVGNYKVVLRRDWEKDRLWKN